MSDMWLGSSDTMRIAPRTMAPLGGFAPWRARPLTADTFAARSDVEQSDEEDEAPAMAPVIDPEAIALDGFTRGYEEGRRALEHELATERTDIRRLAAGLASLRPEPSAALATVMAETVDRLVRRIVGEMPVDGPLLLARARAAAELVTEEVRPARLRLHPADRARLADVALPVELVADEALMPGSVVLECRDGWIEDGPAVALDRLRAQLDRLALPR